MVRPFEDDDPTETVTLDLALTLQALRRDGSLERRFELGDELGRGGMGTVRVGVDKHLGRTVALKVMHESLADSAPLVSRFLLEAQLAAQLEHPNILPVYTLERDALDRPGLAMKLIQGQTYHDYLWMCSRAAYAGPVDTGPYALAARIEPLIKICEALAYAHKRGVIHRDVKPANIMLAEDGQVYLMDWGLARVQNDPRQEILVDIPVYGPSDGHQTRPGQVIGTPAYMSPEQARAENTTLTGAADQFSMGLTLYEAVTLRVARSASDDAVARRQARDALVPQVSHRFGHAIPPRLAAIVQKATMPRAEDRYPSMAHFAEDLRRAFTDAPILAMEETPVRRAVRAVTDRPERAVAVLIALTLAAALGGVLALSGLLGARREASRETTQMAAVQAAAREGAASVARTVGDVTRVVDAVARATATLAQDPAPWGVRRPLAEALYTPEEVQLEWNEEHRHRVGWDRASYYVVPDADPLEWGDDLLRLSRLDELLPHELAWSIGEPAAGPIAARRLAAGEGPLFRTYAILASGIMAHYPAYGEMTRGYDPRTRPAYLDARDALPRRLRDPFVNWDGGQVMVPCTVAVRAPSGDFLGVAGADLSLTRLARALPMPAVGTWREAHLLTGDGEILATATPGEGRFIPATGVPLARVEAKLAQALADRPHGGVSAREGELSAYEQVPGTDWYYVLDAALRSP